jgi:hypothetical protein
MARPVARRPGAENAGLPQWIRPQLTALIDDAPEARHGRVAESPIVLHPQSF